MILAHRFGRRSWRFHGFETRQRDQRGSISGWQIKAASRCLSLSRPGRILPVSRWDMQVDATPVAFAIPIWRIRGDVWSDLRVTAQATGDFNMFI
jgi:hypothetical protein